MLSQRELAKLADVSHVTIARLEGGHDAHPRTVRRLAEALKVTPAELQRLDLSGPAPFNAMRKVAETLDIVSGRFLSSRQLSRLLIWSAFRPGVT